MKKLLAVLLVAGATLIYSPIAQAQYTVTTLSNRVLKKAYVQVANAGASVPGVFCSTSGCVNQIAPFPALTVNCPGTSGTCTLEFNLCARVAPKAGLFNDNYFHTVTVDGAVPSPGPVDLTLAIVPGAFPDQQNFCAKSYGSGIPFGNHSVAITIGAQDLDGNGVHADIPNVVFDVKVYKP